MLLYFTYYEVIAIVVLFAVYAYNQAAAVQATPQPSTIASHFSSFLSFYPFSLII